MYPFYYPSSSYAPSYPSSSADSEYLRALAEERAAREQYAAARRAQEEARQRAARARAARRAYASPYSSFHDDDYDDLDLDMDLDGGAYYPQQRPLSYGGRQPYGYPPSPSYATSPQYSSSPYGLNPLQQRALMEEQRRRELLEEQRRRELLELERERRRQEEERLRRILQEERQREEAERRRILEEERTRRALEEEKLRRAIEEEKLRRALLEEEAARRTRERERAPLGSQQASLEPLLRALGFMPEGLDADLDKERPTRDARTGRGMRAHTTSPNPRRAGAAPRSPIRPAKSHQPSTSPTSSGLADATRTKAPSPAPATTIPITSPKPSPKPAPSKPEAEAKQEVPKPNLPHLANPTPEQVSAAEKIQDAYRTFSARKQALKSISTLRKRFLSAKSAFTLPTTLDYETSADANTREHTTVTVERSAALPSPSLSAIDEHDANPFQHVPKLAYTPTNAPLHAYEEELNRILSALDAVESRGDAGVRAARRELARMVEREAERVERWRGVVWNWWIGREQEQKQQPAQASAVVDGDVPPAPLDQPAEPMQAEPMPQEQTDATSKESEMQVEPSEQPMDSQPVTTSEDAESTPKAAPMEVEPETNPAAAASPAPTSTEIRDQEPIRIPIDSPAPEPQPSADAPSAVSEQPSTPEIDIPDADVDDAAPPVDIEVEPPSRAEPADDDVDIPSAEPPSPIIEEAESASTVSEPDRPSTPPLSHDHSEAEGDAEAEMEVEPQEVHTPPPGAHTPLVVVSPPAGADLHEPQEKDVQAVSAEDAPAQAGQQVGAKGGASPLVDRRWDEFLGHGPSAEPSSS